MSASPAPDGDRPIVVVALGGNALLRRGESPDLDNQRRAARAAARRLAPVARAARLIVTFGNGPQVGLLALLTDPDPHAAPASLDVLDAETEGQTGYLLELELDNAIDHQDTVALLTRTEVDRDDPAFAHPTKPVGPVYPEREARDLARQRGWTVAPDGDGWRRVVPSPQPRRIVQLEAIRRLVDGGFLVVCAGGGGIPVARTPDGLEVGVEAVVDKDLASSLLARDLGADALILATDVDGVYAGWGTPQQRLLDHPTAAELGRLDLAVGSMGPKAQAALAFLEHGGSRAAIGALEEVDALVAGTAGTQLSRAPGR